MSYQHPHVEPIIIPDLDPPAAGARSVGHQLLKPGGRKPEGAPSAPPSPPGGAPSDILAVLQQILHELKEPQLHEQIAFWDGQLTNIRDVHNVPNLNRQVVSRSPQPAAGGNPMTVPTTGALVVMPDVNRMAGQIVNSGANGVYLYLGVTAELAAVASDLAGYGTVYLAANGAWDFKLSDSIWCGSVWGVAVTASTTIAVAVL